MTAIRPADPQHPDALRLMAEGDAEYARLYPPEVNCTLSPEAIARADTAFFLIYDGDTAIGSGGYERHPGYHELKRIFITKEHRGRGLSRRLLAHLEHRCAAEGAPLLRLETGEDSPEALALYTRCGYRRRGPFGAYVENGASVFMEKPLGAVA